MSDLPKFVDIQPTARVLRVLGEIPFEPWQCIAELMDNSIDAFSSSQQQKGRIVVSWSGANVGDLQSTFEILDTGPGMELATLQNCVRAGYTTNDPIGNLGLFGMGFNIATARLGDKTTIFSATESAQSWVGIEIDFEVLIKKGSFQAIVVTMPKRQPGEHGTKITVSRLKPGILGRLRTQETNIRRKLEKVYTPILSSTGIEIMVQNKRLSKRPHCVWDSKRYVSSRDGSKTESLIEIDEVFGEALFNTQLNRYLTIDEETEVSAKQETDGGLPSGIVKRVKRIKGWLGIQRFADPDRFGIDFVRNGRKILLEDKSLFYFENPYTDTKEMEYPVELGSTIGGRIVGEIHIDHMSPNYQKSDFDRAEKSWQEMLEFLRGVGPILPKKRKTFNYTDDNKSPLAKLIGAYRRVDVGTRCLMAPNAQAKEWAHKFDLSDPEYQSDEKWWKAAQEADRAKADVGATTAPPVDAGDLPADDPGLYGPDTGANGITITTTATKTDKHSGKKQDEAPKLEDLKTRSEQLTIFSREYRYTTTRPALNVRVWEVKDGTIGSVENSKPCVRFHDGMECDFFFNPRHSFLATYRVDFKDLLLIYLSEYLAKRDQDHVKDISEVYHGLVINHFEETRIDPSNIVENAQGIFESIREQAATLLTVREQAVLDLIHESSGDVEEIMANLISNAELMGKFQKRAQGAIAAIHVAPPRTMVRLIDSMPEEFFDGKVFQTPYTSIELPDAKATERLRTEAKDRILSFLKDALWALSLNKQSSTPQRRKDELIRCSHSINFLKQEMAV